VASYPGLSPLLEHGARRILSLVILGKPALPVSRLFDKTRGNDAQDEAGRSDTISCQRSTSTWLVGPNGCPGLSAISLVRSLNSTFSLQRIACVPSGFRSFVGVNTAVAQAPYELVTQLSSTTRGRKIT